MTCSSRARQYILLIILLSTNVTPARTAPHHPAVHEGPLRDRTQLAPRARALLLPGGCQPGTLGPPLSQPSCRGAPLAEQCPARSFGTCCFCSDPRGIGGSGCFLCCVVRWFAAELVGPPQITNLPPIESVKPLCLWQWQARENFAAAASQLNPEPARNPSYCLLAPSPVRWAICRRVGWPTSNKEYARSGNRLPARMLSVIHSGHTTCTWLRRLRPTFRRRSVSWASLVAERPPQTK